LEPNQEVEDNGETRDRDKRYWYVDDRKSGCFDEWMIHGRFSMFHYDGSLIEEGGDFGQGRNSRPKQRTERLIKQTGNTGRSTDSRTRR